LVAGARVAHWGWSTNGLHIHHGSASATVTRWSPANTWNTFRIKIQTGSGADGWMSGEWHTNLTFSAGNIAVITNGTGTGTITAFRFGHTNALSGNRFVGDNIWGRAGTNSIPGDDPSPGTIPESDYTLSLLTSNLVSHWALEESSGDRLDSHGTNHLAPSGSPVSATGFLGSAIDLEAGSTQYIQSADNPQLRLGSDEAFTFHLWFNAESFPDTYSTLVWKGDVATPEVVEYVLAYDDTTDIFFFRCGDGAAVSLVTVAYPVGGTGSWHRLMAWHDPVNDVVGIQVDNDTPVTTAYSDGTLNATGQPFAIGRIVGLGYYWDGKVDEVSFWKRVLTADERRILWNGGSPLPYSSY
jgi:hypothetical protein